MPDWMQSAQALRAHVEKKHPGNCKSIAPLVMTTDDCTCPCMCELYFGHNKEDSQYCRRYPKCCELYETRGQYVLPNNRVGVVPDPKVVADAQAAQRATAETERINREYRNHIATRNRKLEELALMQENLGKVMAEGTLSYDEYKRRRQELEDYKNIATQYNYEYIQEIGGATHALPTSVGFTVLGTVPQYSTTNSFTSFGTWRGTK